MVLGKRKEIQGKAAQRKMKEFEKVIGK